MSTTKVSRGGSLVLYRDLVLELLSKEFKVRYKSTVLGYLWSLLNPLAFTLVYYFVFRLVARFETEGLPYSLFLVTGLFPWQWFQNSLTASTGFFLGNAQLIKKLRFPRYLLVLTGVLNDLIHFLISIPVIALFMLLLGRSPSLAWVWLIPLMVFVQLGMTFGLALGIATANLFLRDLERLVGILLLLWFFLTPIVYPAARVPASSSWLLDLNPLASLTTCWRGLLIEGRMPWDDYLHCLAWGAGLTVAGSLVYRRLQWRFAEIV